jgi:hypothetical protein
VSRPRSIDSFLALRFVESYTGEPGRAFREAMAAHFGVDVRTVERELPRLVLAGALEEEVVRSDRPGRPAKAYRVSARVASERGRTGTQWRRLADTDPGGGRSKRKGMALAAELSGVDFETYRGRWMEGVVTYCEFCGRTEPQFAPLSEEWMDGECHSCRVKVPAEGDGEPTTSWAPMVSVYSAGLKPRPDPPDPLRECWCGESHHVDSETFRDHRQMLHWDPGLADPEYAAAVVARPFDTAHRRRER